nr:hypothetical protein [Tanacetum cinerariifolium]
DEFEDDCLVAVEQPEQVD